MSQIEGENVFNFNKTVGPLVLAEMQEQRPLFAVHYFLIVLLAVAGVLVSM